MVGRLADDVNPKLEWLFHLESIFWKNFVFPTYIRQSFKSFAREKRASLFALSVSNYFCIYFPFELSLKLVVMFVCLTLRSSALNLIYSKQLVLLHILSKIRQWIFFVWNTYSSQQHPKMFYYFRLKCSFHFFKRLFVASLVSSAWSNTIKLF